MINRSAILVTPLQPFVDWALGLDDSGIAPSAGDERTTYLIPEVLLTGRRDDMLRRVFGEVFESELEAWHTDPTDWPNPRTFEMFKEWFTVEFCSVVIDVGSGRLADDED